MFEVKVNNNWIPGIYSWILKDPKPKIYSPIIKLTASGEELDYIYRCFRDIPSRLGNDSVIWTGVYAQFIYDNL